MNFSSTEQTLETIQAMQQQEDHYCVTDYFATTSLENTSVDESCRSMMGKWCNDIADVCNYKKETVGIAMDCLDQFMATSSGQNHLLSSQSQSQKLGLNSYSNSNSNSGNYNNNKNNNNSNDKNKNNNNEDEDNNKRQKLNNHLPSLISVVTPNPTPTPKTTKSTTIRKTTTTAVVVVAAAAPTVHDVMATTVPRRRRSSASFSIEQALFFEPYLLSPSLFSHIIAQGEHNSN